MKCKLCKEEMIDSTHTRPADICYDCYNDLQNIKIQIDQSESEVNVEAVVMPKNADVEVHLCLANQLFDNSQCLRVFADDKRMFDVFTGDLIIHIGVDHLVFEKEKVWDILAKLIEKKINFIVTGS
jgi:hypothetical protein